VYPIKHVRVRQGQDTVDGAFLDAKQRRCKTGTFGLTISGFCHGDYWLIIRCVVVRFSVN
jgi:hypothetical protein